MVLSISETGTETCINIDPTLSVQISHNVNPTSQISEPTILEYPLTCVDINITGAELVSASASDILSTSRMLNFPPTSEMTVFLQATIFGFPSSHCAVGVNPTSPASAVLCLSSRQDTYSSEPSNLSQSDSYTRTAPLSVISLAQETSDTPLYITSRPHFARTVSIKSTRSVSADHPTSSWTLPSANRPLSLRITSYNHDMSKSVEARPDLSRLVAPYDNKCASVTFASRRPPISTGKLVIASVSKGRTQKTGSECTDVLHEIATMLRRPMQTTSRGSKAEDSIFCQHCASAE